MFRPKTEPGTYKIEIQKHYWFSQLAPSVTHLPVSSSKHSFTDPFPYPLFNQSNNKLIGQSVSRISGFNSGGYEEYHLLGYNAV
jgi:hypothetical protein